MIQPGLKTAVELQIMAKSGSMASKVLKTLLIYTKPGVTLAEIDQLATKEIHDLGGLPSFKTVDSYKYATCINVNQGIVHGIPNSYKVKVGDVVSIDLGVLYKGYHSDLSYTFEVQTTKYDQFLQAGKEALFKAVKKCVEGKTVGDISATIQNVIEGHHYSVSRDLVGHGVGKQIHEYPNIPCYGEPATGPKLRSGMVLAVEVIYQLGRPELKLLNDGWTLETADGSISALFEQTVAVGKKSFSVLTPFDF